MGHCALGRALGLAGEVSEARGEIEEALRLAPSTAQSHFALAFLLTHWGEPEAALAHFERAERLSPHDPHIWTFFHNHALALYRLGRLDEAVETVRHATRQPNTTYWPFATLASILGTQGKEAEARAAVARLVELKPGYGCAYAADDFFFARKDEFIENYVEGLRAAGVPA
jgi:adenylate cyclase